MVKINPPRPRTAAAFTVLAVVCLIIAFAPAPVTSGDWAAWIQGAGTILAVALVSWTRNAPPPTVVDAHGETRVVARRTEQLEQAVASLHRAAADLDLAIWDGDFRRVRDGVALVSEGPAFVSLERLINGPAADWPGPGLRNSALEVRQAALDLAQLLPEPEPEPGNEEALEIWWEILKTAVARLRLVASRLLKDLEGLDRG